MWLFPLRHVVIRNFDGISSCSEGVLKFLICSCNFTPASTESQKSLDWKRPQRSPSPALNPANSTPQPSPDRFEAMRFFLLRWVNLAGFIVSHPLCGLAGVILFPVASRIKFLTGHCCWLGTASEDLTLVAPQVPWGHGLVVDFTVQG